MTQDPYAALGLSKTATADEIKKAYRKIARTERPDLKPDDPPLRPASRLQGKPTNSSRTPSNESALTLEK